MGWCESLKHPGVILGDEAFDHTYDFVKRLSALYQEAHGRKVTLDELRVLLETALWGCGDELLHELEARQVCELSIKTTARRKRQRYRPGDLFAIPLGEGYFAYGRVMREKTASGVLVEIFSEVSRGMKESIAQIDSTRLFHPVHTFGIPFEEWE